VCGSVFLHLLSHPTFSRDNRKKEIEQKMVDQRRQQLETHVFGKKGDKNAPPSRQGPPSSSSSSTSTSAHSGEKRKQPTPDEDEASKDPEVLKRQKVIEDRRKAREAEEQAKPKSEPEKQPIKTEDKPKSEEKESTKKSESMATVVKPEPVPEKTQEQIKAEKKAEREAKDKKINDAKARLLARKAEKQKTPAP
jgi:hypothetical protein